jgi:hypothetical protein
MGLGARGIEPHGLLEMRERICRPSDAEEDVSEVVVRPGVIRPQLNVSSN